MSDGFPQSPSKSAIRCVIWHAAAMALPGELLSSLSKRIGHMAVATDGYAALAELCKIERDRRAALTAGLPPSSSGVLLLVYPRQLIGGKPAEIIESARLYAPSCTLWQYDRTADGANSKLRTVVEEDVRSWNQTRPLPSAPGVSGIDNAAITASDRAGMREVSSLSPRPSPPTNGKHSHPHPAQRPTPIARPLTQLTEDELNMLLSDEPVFPISPPPPARRDGGPR